VVSDLFVNALFSARCALWDVGNEFLYLTAQSEGEAKRLGPTFLIEDEPALDAAKEDALRGINAELVADSRRSRGADYFSATFLSLGAEPFARAAKLMLPKPLWLQANITRLMTRKGIRRSACTLTRPRKGRSGSFWWTWS
jgi:hypothetical protein